MDGKTDRTVVRNESFTRAAVGIRERHNERKNGKYANTDIVPERLDQNVWFKRCEGTYERTLDKMVKDGVVSTRGLKPDAKVFGELVFDVNTYYFEMNGGYEYAKKFFEEVFRFAKKEIGTEYVLSAVMHSDEIHQGYKQAYGREMYHYHLHVVYLPVVQKEIKWSKRCKDPALIGTTKEVISQISNSKKWAFVQAKDEDGSPLLGKNGKPILIPSYSILQDKFYEHMASAGFEGFERGERGSTAEHLTIIEYKSEKAAERLAETKEKIVEQEVRLETILSNVKDVEHIEAYADDVSRMGKFNSAGRIELTENQHITLTTLAREGLYSRRTIENLKREATGLKEQIIALKSRITDLLTETRVYYIASRLVPEKVKVFLEDVIARGNDEAKLLAEKYDYRLEHGLDIIDQPVRKTRNKELFDLNR